MDRTYQSFPNPPSEDVILGMPEGRNLSPVRRFFVLLATFDFLFTVLLWTLSVIIVKGGDHIIETFEAEVLQFSFKVSIFDLVMCSASRFVILLLFYGLLRCHHWLPVAFTTAASCAFLLSKVFLFGWKEYGSAPWPVFLVLTSFVISWSEAWFLDFRVVPLEKQAQCYLARQAASVSQGQSGVMPWLSQSVSHALNSANPGTMSYPESVANFFSPLQSPMQSDGEDENSETESNEKRNRRLMRLMNDTPESKMWLQQGPVMANELLDRVASAHWVHEKHTNNGDTVFSQKLNRKIYKICGAIPVSPDRVVFELFQNFEAMPHWCPSVTRCEILQKLDADTDVSYQVSKDGSKGAVSPRDFVVLRHHKKDANGGHILAWASVKHPSKPKQSPLIRGVHGIGGWILSPSLVNPNETEFQWILDIDLQLKAWIPKLIIDNALLSATLETLTCLRHKVTFMPDQVELAVEVNNPRESFA